MFAFSAGYYTLPQPVTQLSIFKICILQKRVKYIRMNSVTESGWKNGVDVKDEINGTGILSPTGLDRFLKRKGPIRYTIVVILLSRKR